MKTWFRCVSFAMVLAALILTTAAAVMSDARETEPFVFEPTMTFFWHLAHFQIRNPEDSSRLLRIDPWDPGRSLASLEVGFKEYESSIAHWRLSPVILFLRHGSDPAQEARRHKLTVDSWADELAPPALLSGPEVDTLVVFLPLAKDDRMNGRLSYRKARSAGFPSLAQYTQKGRFDSRVYSVVPPSWNPAARIEHTRCGYPGQGMELVTKLTYKGGITDSAVTRLSNRDWKRCELLSSEPGLRAAVARQKSRDNAAGPVIVAGSYFQDPFPGPLLARWIKVR